MQIAGEEIVRRSRRMIPLSVGQLYDGTDLKIPVEVIAGKKEGPVLFVSAAIHGDEINGVAIVQKLSRLKALKDLCGTLLLIPIVNVFGFNSRTRYLPDRRDLNRSFPGNAKGSLAAQIAHVFMTEIVQHATHGIDLHTAAVNRTNLPQIRACIDEPETRELALAFGAPVVINANIRDGSLRQSAAEHEIPMLLYEGGEALRLNQSAIRLGVQGILSVMRHIGMLPSKGDRLSLTDGEDGSDRGMESMRRRKRVFHHIARGSIWVRANAAGLVQPKRGLGQPISEGDLLALITDPTGHHIVKVFSRVEGVIVGMITMPLVNKGDAMFHIATFQDASSVIEQIEVLELADDEWGQQRHVPEELK